MFMVPTVADFSSENSQHRAQRRRLQLERRRRQRILFIVALIALLMLLLVVVVTSGAVGGRQVNQDESANEALDAKASTVQGQPSTEPAGPPA